MGCAGAEVCAASAESVFVRCASSFLCGQKSFHRKAQLREGYRHSLYCQTGGKTVKWSHAFVREPEAKILTDTQGAAGIAPSGKSEKPGKKKGCISRIKAIRDSSVPWIWGTTTVVMQLTDRQSGNVLYTYAFQNPQRMYGIDVLAGSLLRKKAGQICCRD